MQKIFASPLKYVQGADTIKQVSEHISSLGKKHALFIMNRSDEQRFGPSLFAHWSRPEVRREMALCEGECTKAEIHRLTHLAREMGCDIVVGVGGGKTIDTAKCVAHFAGVASMIVPTIASTDAPCSAVSVIYHPTGTFEEYIFFPKNPDMVLVDTQVIAKAPVRFLVAGMGDALSTFFEARACRQSYAKNNLGGFQTNASFAIAKLCHETLLSDGEKALAACASRVVTPALENIIEANILLSGLGFESGGLAAAHAIHNGLTLLEECHGLYHGEKVAFGVLVQLILENAPMDEFSMVQHFCKRVGLPITFADLKVAGVDRERFLEVAERACAEQETIHHMPFPVRPEEVYAAMLTVDRLGQSGFF